MFPFFHSPETSPDSHDSSNTMENSSTTTSGSSFRPLECIDLSTFSLIMWSWTCSLPTVAGILFSQPHPEVQGHERPGRPTVSEDQGKELTEYLSLLQVCCSQFSLLVYQRGYIFPGLSLLTSCTCRIPYYFSYPSSPSSVPFVSWHSWSCLCMSRQHPCTLPRPHIPTSTPRTCPSFRSVWAAGPWSAMLVPVSPAWVLKCKDGELLHSVRKMSSKSCQLHFIP